jgi:glycosyltransferase involved in cell wall biosynthesis
MSAASAGADAVQGLELTILMPCLNEAATIGSCILKAKRFLVRAGVKGEILVADNGSTDTSVAIATEVGARVVPVPVRGYGAALITGIQAARGRFIIMGDSDDSYDFERLEAFIEALRQGADLVMGNRFRGGIEPGAMPALHRWLGNPVLSGLGRLMYCDAIGDFHCGLRGFDRDAIRRLNLCCPGMEFASEMVLKASLNGLRIMEVPTTLRPDGRGRPPHLRSWRDGWRHLRLLLLFSPGWLFMVPGMALLILGVFGQLALLPGPLMFSSMGLDVHTLLYCAGATILGLQLLLFGALAKVFAVGQGVLPRSRLIELFLELVPVEAGLIFGGIMVTAGAVLTTSSIAAWDASMWGQLDPSVGMRSAIPAVTLLVTGMQVVFASMFVGVLGLRTHTEQRSTTSAVEAAAAPGRA